MAKQVAAWEAGSENTLGIVTDTDGTFLALTRAESGKPFLSSSMALEIARLGYRADGTKF